MSAITGAPSRRGLLTGGVATLVASAAIGCQTKGDVISSSQPMPTIGETGEDAELLALAQQFWRHQAVLEAWNAGQVGEEVGESHSRAWWQCCRAMTPIVPQTQAGKAAKASVALRALEMVQDDQHDVETLVRAVLTENGNRPHTESTPDPDAELIALCDRLVVWETKYDAIYLAMPDDNEADHAAAPMMPEYDEIKRRLYALDAPKTIAGQQAFARAAMASATRYSDGTLMLDDGGNIGSYLAFGLAHSMAGETQA